MGDAKHMQAHVYMLIKNKQTKEDHLAAYVSSKQLLSAMLRPRFEPMTPLPMIPISDT